MIDFLFSDVIRWRRFLRTTLTSSTCPHRKKWNWCSSKTPSNTYPGSCGWLSRSAVTRYLWASVDAVNNRWRVSPVTYADTSACRSNWPGVTIISRSRTIWRRSLSSLAEKAKTRCSCSQTHRLFDFFNPSFFLQVKFCYITNFALLFCVIVKAVTNFWVFLSIDHSRRVFGRHQQYLELRWGAESIYERRFGTGDDNGSSCC